jgi:hypothetical protein
MEAHFHAVSGKVQRTEEQLSHMQQVIETFCMALDDRFEQQETRDRLRDRVRVYQEFLAEMQNIGIRN